MREGKGYAMSVHVEWWDDDKRIILYEFSGKWTWEEFYPAYHESIQMMDSVDYKVNFIMDLLQSQHIPPGALHHIKRAADFNHPNMGLAVYVGINPLIQAMEKMSPDPIATPGHAFDPAQSPAANLPGGRMTAGQRAFVEGVWQPRVRPELVRAGFWKIADVS